jgi:hypothetical protein
MDRRIDGFKENLCFIMGGLGILQLDAVFHASVLDTHEVEVWVRKS